MGLNDTKKWLLALFGLAIAGAFYLYFAEPVFIKKTELTADPGLAIPDISVDEKFFDKIESLKDNNVVLDKNSEVNNNPFARK